jgi:hypothetical protein
VARLSKSVTPCGFSTTGSKTTIMKQGITGGASATRRRLGVSVNPAQARCVRQAALLSLAHLSGDNSRRDQLLAGFEPRLDACVEGFAFLSVSAANIFVLGKGGSPEDFLASLPVLNEELLPGAPVAWAIAVRLASSVSKKLPTAALVDVGKQMDVPTAINSSFSVAIASLHYLSSHLGNPATSWATAIAEGAEAEM